MFLEAATPHKEGGNYNFSGLWKPLEMELTLMEVKGGEVWQGGEGHPLIVLPELPGTEETGKS